MDFYALTTAIETGTVTLKKDRFISSHSLTDSDNIADFYFCRNIHAWLDN